MPTTTARQIGCAHAMGAHTSNELIPLRVPIAPSLFP
jgi:hypothetical protein